MTIQPILVSNVTKAACELLTDHPNIGGAGVTVERSEPVNQSPQQTGWVGVYRERQAFPPRALGMGSGFRQQRITLLIVVQEWDMTSGTECEDRLEILLRSVISALLSDHSIKGTVATLEDFDVQYSDYQKVDDAYSQQAIIRVTGVGNVSAT